MYFGSGRWNDSPDRPLFPTCQVQVAPAAALGAQMVWGSGRTSSFNLKICVDQEDTVFFQDVRISKGVTSSSKNKEVLVYGLRGY